jgi:RNA polymerase primary sigma factor
MYMREMGAVALLTREGEIEIAKRIEGGLKDMIQAISACPTTIAKSSRWRKIARDEMKVDEVVDGFVDPNESARPRPLPPRLPSPATTRKRKRKSRKKTATPMAARPASRPNSWRS